MVRIPVCFFDFQISVPAAGSSIVATMLASPHPDPLKMSRTTISASSANFSITSGGGPAHAAWGAANATTVNARGEVNQREDVRPEQTGTATATARTITREAVKRIYAQVVACGFFELEPTYRDPQVMDGGSNYVSVTANGKTHSVAMVNFDVDRVWSIVRVLREEIEAPK